MRLILASASPRRAELLANAGFEFDVRPADVDESPREGEAPDAYVLRVARDKAAAAAALARPDDVVLGADTTVVLGDVILGKPRDDNEARAMLEQLSGRDHHVLTGISLRRGAREVGRVESTRVTFAPLTPQYIQWYLDTAEGRDKAGAYAIQGYASRFIPRIDGSYSNVVGLPVAAVVELLAQLTGGEAGR